MPLFGTYSEEESAAYRPNFQMSGDGAALSSEDVPERGLGHLPLDLFGDLMLGERASEWARGACMLSNMGEGIKRRGDDGTRRHDSSPAAGGAERQPASPNGRAAFNVPPAPPPGGAGPVAPALRGATHRATASWDAPKGCAPARPAEVEPPMSKSADFCIFATFGKCRFGAHCKNVHGLQCPRCLIYCLHPHDVDRNEAHLEECLATTTATAAHDGGRLSPFAEEGGGDASYYLLGGGAAADGDDASAYAHGGGQMMGLECGLCHQIVAQKEDPRYGLLTCDHVFCLKCIRSWRAEHTMEEIATHSCPNCRTSTFFIVPSSRWTADAGEKAKIVGAYKKKMGEINCKHFNMGDGTCPFGGSCFYAHRLREQSSGEERARARTYVDQSEQIKTVRERTLSDFIHFVPPRGSRASKNK